MAKMACRGCVGQRLFLLLGQGAALGVGLARSGQQLAHRGILAGVLELAHLVRFGQHGKLEVARQELAQRETALTERGIALEHAVELAKSQLQGQTMQLEKAGRELERARSSLVALVQERDADRRQFDEQLGTLAEERQRTE